MLDGKIFYATYLEGNVLNSQDFSPDIILKIIEYWDKFFAHIEDKTKFTYATVPMITTVSMTLGAFASPTITSKVKKSSDGSGLKNTGMELANKMPIPSQAMADNYNLMFDFLCKSAYTTITGITVEGNITTANGAVPYSDKTVAPPLIGLMS